VYTFKLVFDNMGLRGQPFPPRKNISAISCSRDPISEKCVGITKVLNSSSRAGFSRKSLGDPDLDQVTLQTLGVKFPCCLTLLKTRSAVPGGGANKGLTELERKIHPIQNTIYCELE